MADGTAGYAVLVNANAKRGGRRVAVQIAGALPGASVRLTRSRDEIRSWLRLLRKTAWPRRCILSAGGDGTAVGLLTALREVMEPGEPFPLVGVLPLGTGNGWAHALGAPKLDRCLRELRRAEGPLPARHHGLFDVTSDGDSLPHLAHFAGSGWDAMVLDDYRQQLAASKGPATWFTKTIYGYVAAGLLRTVPRVMVQGNPSVKVESLEGDAYLLEPSGRLLKVHAPSGAEATVLYEGPVGSAAVGTTPEFGYGFRAFPFGERWLGMMNVRIYVRTALGAVADAYALWRGKFPMGGMHDFFSRAVRLTFSRPVPLQIGGDAMGTVTRIEYRMEPRTAPMLDWRGVLGV